MSIIVGILCYVAVASIAMFFTVRWDNRLDGRDCIDDGHIYIAIAIFWPIAFPIWTAYVLAHAAKDE